MGKCDIDVQLDEPDRIYQGGEKVQGVVTVNVSSKVKSKKLTISSGWSTHGRGNIDQAQQETVTEFPGEWLPGKEYRYPFELTASRWPPTYHGEYLSVDHYINARAYLAWAFDPKSSAPFQVFAAEGPEVMGLEEAKNSGCGKFVGIAFISIFVILFLVNPIFWIFGAIIGLVAGAYWFVWRYLPKRMLGEVKFELAKDKVIPGEVLEGELSFLPNSNVPINKITWHVTATEVCVSGSGTNKTTHRKVVESFSEDIMGEGEFKSAEQVRIPLRLEIPTNPVFSLNLGSNTLTWTSQLHIDIPRWPDWKRSKAFTVYPPPISESGAQGVSGIIEKKPPPQGAPIVDEFDQPDGISFDETAAMVFASLGDDSTLNELVAAVEGLDMRVTAMIEGRVVYEGNDPLGHQGGYSVLAHSQGEELPMMIYIPKEQRDQFSQLSGMVWAGTGQIVGYSHRLDRLLVRIA